MMELRSTGNPCMSNPATMSMLEYLAKKGREAMSRKMTFGDKIRSMNDDELATMLCNTLTYDESEDPMLSIWVDREISMYHSYGDILDWLKQPVED